MLNFLFGVMCASGAVFGAFLTYGGVTGGGYEAIIAGGVFLFGSLLTFGLGQIHRSMRVRRKQNAHPRPAGRSEPVFKRPGALPWEEPESGRAEPVIAHPVLERVASRFARPHR